MSSDFIPYGQSLSFLCLIFNRLIFIAFLCCFFVLRNAEAGFPILVTDNKQDLTLCYPQKVGITV